jgi:hypothetical protein
MSNNHIDPDFAVETFVLASASDEGPTGRTSA